jgi:amino acid adenylation domain-containing protein
MPEIGVAPLAFGQERMWLLQQLRPASAALNIPSAVRIDSPVDQQALQRAIQILTERHDALRLRVTRSPAGAPCQHTEDAQGPLIYRYSCDTAASLTQTLHEIAARPFNLASEPPARWYLVEDRSASPTPASHVLVLVMHHIAADAWSLRCLLEELIEEYGVACTGEPRICKKPSSTLDYARWQRHSLEGSPTWQQDLAFWRARLANPPDRLQLAFDHPTAQANSFAGGCLVRRLPSPAINELLVLGRRAGATSFMTLLAAYQALLSRLSGQDDLIVGIPVGDRDRPEFQRTVGCLLNTLALRADLSGRPSLRSLLTATAETCLDAFEHRQMPFERVLEQLAIARSAEHTPLFQTMFVFDGAPSQPIKLGGATCTPLELPRVATQYDLTLMICRDAEGWYAAWDYRSDLFELATIVGYAECFDALLEHAAQAPDLPITHLRLTRVPHPQQLFEAQGSSQPRIPVSTLPALFEARVAAHPLLPALCDTTGALSYAELDRVSDELARGLLSAGVRPGERIAISLPRSRELIGALLAVSKAGAAFIVLDPALPAERVAWIARDAGVRLHITQQSVLETVAAATTPVSFPTVDADDVAYLIYTSGSTGAPKGVVLAHRGLAQLLELHRAHFGVGPGAHVLQYAPFSFDAAIWEVVMSLLSGACLHLAPPEQLAPGAPLAAQLQSGAITHLTIPPSNVTLLENLPSSLQHLILAGEPCPAELVQRWGHQVHIWNAYGPTEATVCATIRSCAGLADGRAPDIGTAIAGAQAWVLDEALNPLPPGVPGELYLGGDGLALGYLNKPELTAQRFVPNPFAQRPGERLYRTGDLARLGRDGGIEFLGRLDEQIKVRGVRIEPGEIENALRALVPTLTDVAVVALKQGEQRHLVACYCSPIEIDHGPVLEALAARLPAYMMPARLQPLDSFPLTTNGKLDRRALTTRATAIKEPQKGSAAAPGLTSVEKEVAAIWQSLLPDTPFGRNDSFFAIGGTSLTLTRMHELLEKQHPGAVKMVDLFRLNTVAAIAGALHGRSGHSSGAAPLTFRL